MLEMTQLVGCLHKAFLKEVNSQNYGADFCQAGILHVTVILMSSLYLFSLGVDCPPSSSWQVVLVQFHYLSSHLV